MKIAFVGYMASGKSLWAKVLSSELNLPFIDLDEYLEVNYLKMSVEKFIHKKGELAFRKLEKVALNELWDQKTDFVLACGGGTPCYFENMRLLNQHFFTIYLNTSIRTLVERLQYERVERPLVSHLKDDELQEFVAKHLFERRYYYAQAHLTLSETEMSLKNILAALPA